MVFAITAHQQLVQMKTDGFCYHSSPAISANENWWFLLRFCVLDRLFQAGVHCVTCTSCCICRLCGTTEFFYYGLGWVGGWDQLRRYYGMILKGNCAPKFVSEVGTISWRACRISTWSKCDISDIHRCMVTQYENAVEISLSWSVCRFILTRKVSWLRMVASIDSGNLLLFRLEPRGSADDPVMHSSEWNSFTALDIPPCLHVCVGYPDECRCGSWQPIYQARAAMKYHD